MRIQGDTYWISIRNGSFTADDKIARKAIATSDFMIKLFVFYNYFYIKLYHNLYL